MVPVSTTTYELLDVCIATQSQAYPSPVWLAGSQYHRLSKIVQQRQDKQQQQLGEASFLDQSYMSLASSGLI